MWASSANTSALAACRKFFEVKKPLAEGQYLYFEQIFRSLSTHETAADLVTTEQADSSIYEDANPSAVYKYSPDNVEKDCPPSKPSRKGAATGT